MLSAPTRSRTSRLRHRRPVLCPAELWTHTEAPTGIEPAASWVETRCSLQMSYGAIREFRGWPGRNRTGRLPPCREGALPLSYRPMTEAAAAPGFEPGPLELTARRATVLHHAAVQERKGFGPLRQRTCADLPGQQPGPLNQILSRYLSEVEGERVERSCEELPPLPFSRRWPLPMGDPSIVINRVGPDGIEPPTSSMWARRSTD